MIPDISDLMPHGLTNIHCIQHVNQIKAEICSRVTLDINIFGD